jgi:hypothetical protein
MGRAVSSCRVEIIGLRLTRTQLVWAGSGQDFLHVIVGLGHLFFIGSGENFDTCSTRRTVGRFRSDFEQIGSDSIGLGSSSSDLPSGIVPDIVGI